MSKTQAARQHSDFERKQAVAHAAVFGFMRAAEMFACDHTSIRRWALEFDQCEEVRAIKRRLADDWMPPARGAIEECVETIAEQARRLRAEPGPMLPDHVETLAGALKMIGYVTNQMELVRRVADRTSATTHGTGAGTEAASQAGSFKRISA